MLVIVDGAGSAGCRAAARKTFLIHVVQLVAAVGDHDGRKACTGTRDRVVVDAARMGQRHRVRVWQLRHVVKQAMMHWRRGLLHRVVVGHGHRGLGALALCDGSNLAIFSTALDALVAVLVERGKLFEQLLVVVGDDIVWLHGRKLGVKLVQRAAVESVLVGLNWQCRQSMLG